MPAPAQALPPANSAVIIALNDTHVSDPDAAPTPPVRSDERTMRREITAPLAVLIVVNATIGTGIFKTPARVARLVGSLPATFVLWAAGGAVALAGALSLAELAAAIPRTGGIYEYLRRAYGPTPAFLLGWAKLTLLIPSAVGSFARLGSESLASLLQLPADARRETLVAVLFVVACGVANLAGVRNSARQQAVITTAKYLGVLLLAALGLLAPIATTGPISAAHATSPTIAGCFTALVSVMWAYDGWADLASLSGEVHAPERSLPRALVLGTGAIVVVYLLANLAYARALGLDGLQRSTTGEHMAAANLATVTLGPRGRTVLSALILISCTGGCLSSLLTGSRVFVPLATDRLFPAALGAVSRSSGVPVRAVLVCSGLGAAYVSFRSFEQLTDAFVAGYFPFYILAVGAVFVLRAREPNLARPFRVPGYPFVPAVFIGGAVMLLVGAVADVDHSALYALAVLLAGLPLRALWRARNRAAGRG